MNKCCGKIVGNIIGAHEDGVVEMTTKKTLHGKEVAKTPKNIVDNIM